MADELLGKGTPLSVDSGLACLVMLARFHNVAASPEQLTHEYAEDGRLFGRAEMLQPRNWVSKPSLHAVLLLA